MQSKIINKNILEIENNNWVSKFNLGSDMLTENEISKIQCAKLAAYTNPHCCPKILSLIGDLLAYLFVDDGSHACFFICYC